MGNKITNHSSSHNKSSASESTLTPNDSVSFGNVEPANQAATPSLSSSSFSLFPSSSNSGSHHHQQQQQQQHVDEGYAFRAVTTTEDHMIVINSNELKRLLTHRTDINDRPVVVVSIAGVFRRGKSFILDFIIRYLESHMELSMKQPLLKRSDKWLQTDCKKSDPWRCWLKRGRNNANSIYLWSRAYVRRTAQHGQVVVLLADVEMSAFECPVTVQDSANVFALSLLLSSVQIFNVLGEIDESDLQHLQLFIECAKKALQQQEQHEQHSSHSKRPFQVNFFFSLFFLNPQQISLPFSFLTFTLEIDISSSRLVKTIRVWFRL